MGKKQTSILMEEDLREWLSEQPGSMADTIRRAVQMYRIFRDPIRKLGSLDEEAMMDVLEIISEAAGEYRDDGNEGLASDEGSARDLDGSMFDQYDQPDGWHALKKLGLVLIKTEAREEGFRRMKPKRAGDGYSAKEMEFAP